jgi:hypothetical protein
VPAPPAVTPDPPVPPTVALPPLTRHQNYYTALDSDDGDELSTDHKTDNDNDNLSVENAQSLYDAMTDADPPPDPDDDSETDFSTPPPDRMLTDSPDSSYCPSITAPDLLSEDELTADASDDLSAVYADQRLPPQELHPAAFDLMDFEVNLSQQAFLHYRQIDEHVTNTLPQRRDEFQELLSHAVRTNKDPTSLETTVKGWTIHHHP